jgi:DNA-binding MarR family transcriptional regulator
MEDNTINRITENLHSILPIIHKKLIGTLSEGVSLELSHYHYAILGMLSQSDALPVSAIGRRLLISKPQMTAMTDKLVRMGLVTRRTDAEDRRIIHISLTVKGRKALDGAVKRMNRNVKRKLSRLKEEDLNLLEEALANIKLVGSKID